jgi:hypothetical protein
MEVEVSRKLDEGFFIICHTDLRTQFVTLVMLISKDSFIRLPSRSLACFYRKTC